MQSQQQNSSKITYIITAVVLIGAAVYYFYYSGGTPVDDSSSLTSSSASDVSNSQVGQDVLTLLNEIHSLNINTKFFTGSAYQSLVDFSVAVPSVNVGRSNPFSPISGSVAGGGTAPSLAPAGASASSSVPAKR